MNDGRVEHAPPLYKERSDHDELLPTGGEGPGGWNGTNLHDLSLTASELNRRPTE
jgi:hypothetical protein